jgi:hypothetical protein
VAENLKNELAIKVWRDSSERVQKLVVLHTTTLENFENMLQNLLSKVKHAAMADEWDVKRVKRRFQPTSSTWPVHSSPGRVGKSSSRRSKKNSPRGESSDGQSVKRRSPGVSSRSSSPSVGRGSLNESGIQGVSPMDM